MSLVPRGVCPKKKYKNKENRANFGSQVCLPKILGLFMDFESEPPGDHCRVYIGKFGPQRWLTKKKIFVTFLDLVSKPPGDLILPYIGELKSRCV